jgi:sugar-specific transcriptional regulator TrmB
MLNQSVKEISPQAASIYRLLLKSQELTAAKIGKELNIYPHAVYRAVKSLVQMGLIDQSEAYPVQYKTKQSEDALNIYLNNARESFLKSFFPLGIDKTTNSSKAASSGVPMSFIKDRQDMLAQSNADMKSAKKEVIMIVSGLVASTETILAYKRASDRGVRIRIIVQRLDEANTEMLKNWKKLGVEVRYYPLIEARIILFDSQISYIVSYNPNAKEEGIGVRFNYTPITLLMSELFEKRWKLAKEIN